MYMCILNEYIHIYIYKAVDLNSFMCKWPFFADKQVSLRIFCERQSHMYLTCEYRNMTKCYEICVATFLVHSLITCQLGYATIPFLND